VRGEFTQRGKAQNLDRIAGKEFKDIGKSSLDPDPAGSILEINLPPGDIQRDGPGDFHPATGDAFGVERRNGRDGSGGDGERIGGRGFERFDRTEAGCIKANAA
jgi:hypothetical protein